MTIWIDGTFRTAETATIPAYDHGLLYGDGLFEGIRAYGGRIFRLDAHIDRLGEGRKALMLACPLEDADLKAVLQDVVERETQLQEEQTGMKRGAKKNAGGLIGDTYIRLVLTRGTGPLGLDPTGCDKPSLIIIADGIRLYPEEYYQNGVPVVSSAIRRNDTDSLDPRIKSLNYLNNILAKMQARQAGAQEALMLNHQGFIAECTGDNVILVKGKTLKVPAGWNGSLDGITLRAVLELARRLDMRVEHTNLALFDAYTADEIILTGTAAEVVPVSSMDGRKLGKPGPVFQALRAAFHKALADDPAWVEGINNNLPDNGKHNLELCPAVGMV